MRSKLLCVLAATLFFSLLLRTRGWPDVITSRVVRAPRQGLSPGCRASRRPLGARGASQACAGVDAGRACSIQAIEALCRLWTQGSTGIELGTLRSSTSLRCDNRNSPVSRMATLSCYSADRSGNGEHHTEIVEGGYRRSRRPTNQASGSVALSHQ